MSNFLNSLLTPLLTAVEAADELGHRLICRTSLHLIVCTLPFAALGAAEHIGRRRLVNFKHLRLPLDRHFHVVAPLLGVEFGKRHCGNVVRLEFALLQAVNQAGIANIGRGVNIRDGPPSTNLIQCLKFRIFPDSANRAALCIFKGEIEDTTLEVYLLGGR